MEASVQKSLFVEYEKMSEDTNCWVSKKLNAVKKWVALEKVHGANFSFIVQRDCSVLVAKRGALLTEKEDFFGVWRQKGFLDEEREKAKRIFSAAVRELKDALTAVTIYGELFGGSLRSVVSSRMDDVTLVTCRTLSSSFCRQLCGRGTCTEGGGLLPGPQLLCI